MTTVRIPRHAFDSGDHDQFVSVFVNPETGRPTLRVENGNYSWDHKVESEVTLTRAAVAELTLAFAGLYHDAEKEA